MFLSLSNLIKFPLLAADSTGGAAPSGEMSKEAMFEFLNKDDDPAEVIDLEPKDKKDAKGTKRDSSKEDEDKLIEKDETEDTDDDDDEEEDEKGDDEDEDDLSELEEDLEDPDEEKLELVTPVRRKEILKAYPDLFKKFPYLEKAYYREQQFTKVFPTVDDAKQAHEASESLKQMEADLMDGNPEVVLTAIKNQDFKSFAKLVDNLLPTLAKVDNDAYLNVAGNLIKHTIYSMYTKGKEKGEAGTGLVEAAATLNEFIFNSSTYTAPKGLSEGQENPKDNKEKLKLQQEKEDFNRTRFETARGEANTRINNSIKSTIEANIDPKDTMTPYVKKMAVRQVQEEVEKLIMGDKRFATIVDQLWKKAQSSNYAKDGVDNVVTAFRSRARTLLLPVIKKARIEALRGMGKRVREEKEEEPTPRTRRSKEDEPSSKRTGRITNPKDIPAGMSSRDFLMSDE